MFAFSTGKHGISSTSSGFNLPPSLFLHVRKIVCATKCNSNQETAFSSTIILQGCKTTITQSHKTRMGIFQWNIKTYTDRGKKVRDGYSVPETELSVVPDPSEDDYYMDKDGGTMMEGYSGCGRRTNWPIWKKGCNRSWGTFDGYPQKYHFCSWLFALLLFWSWNKYKNNLPSEPLSAWSCRLSWSPLVGCSFALY